MEVLAENSGLVSGDPKVQELVRIATTTVGSNVGKRLAEIDASSLDPLEKQAARLRIEDWGTLVFRSVLASAGKTVLDDPKRFLGIGEEGEQKLVKEVGTTFLDLVLDESKGLEAVFSKDGLEALIGDALEVLGEHPEILLDTDNQGLKNLLSDIATELSQAESLLDQGLFVDVARLIVQKTPRHLELIWPGLASSPRKKLLLVATKTTLEILGRPAADGEWDPRFGRAEVLEVVETVIDEISANPAWILAESERVSPLLAQVLTAVFDTLRKRGDRRLSPALGIEIVRSALRAVTLRREFTKLLPASSERAGQRIIEAAIDVILSTVFDQSNTQATWQLLRAEVIEDLVDVALETLARTRLKPAVIAELEGVLNETAAALGRGEAFDVSTFAARLEAALLPTP